MAELQEILPFTKKLSVLYVEEDNNLRDTIMQPLRKIFARVDDAGDGYDGLSHYKINPYDLVILDKDVPNMKGPLLITNIKNIRPDQRIIVTYGSITNEELLELTNLGIDAIVQKPYKMSEMLDHVLRCAKIIYGKQKQEEVLARAETLKEQHAQRIEELQTKEQKFKDELAYERKRIGRFMQKERELRSEFESVKKKLETEGEGTRKKLEDELSTAKKQVETFRMINETTGLASRHALQTALVQKGKKAMVYLNIDHFDLINSIYGMGQGNKVLKETALRLQKFLPDNAKLYHVTADEFAIVLSEPVASQELLLAEQIQALFKESPLEVDGYSYEIGFSIGLDRGEDGKLFVQSKTASKEARYNGGGQIVLFNPQSEYIQQQRKNLYWIRMVKEAIVHDRIRLLYQPIRNNDDVSVKHFEVLCRILDNNNQLVEATHFINPAAVAGVLTKMTRIVIDKAFRYFSQNSYNFSINISRQDLLEGYLEEFLKHKCQQHRVAPNRVSLEIVEDSTLTNSKTVFEQIGRLRRIGFHVMVDDFGAEYSVFSKVLRMHANFIKIDSSFIDEIATNPGNRLVVENIVAFAKRAGIKTIAEHVNSAEAQKVVEEVGVDYSQGFYIGKPAPQTGA